MPRALPGLVRSIAHSYHNDRTRRHAACPQTSITMLIRTYRRTYSVQFSDNMLPQLRIKCGVAKSCPGTHTALQVPMANSGISTVDRDTEQLSRAMQLTLYHASHACVPTHAQKLSTLNFGFSRNILRQKFSFHVEKKNSW